MAEQFFNTNQHQESAIPKPSTENSPNQMPKPTPKPVQPQKDISPPSHPSDPTSNPTKSPSPASPPPQKKDAGPKLPLGITLFYITHYILGASLILFGVFLFFSGLFFKSFLQDFSWGSRLLLSGTGPTITFGFGIIAIGIFFIFLGSRLKKKEDWARKAEMTLLLLISVLGIVILSISMARGVNPSLMTIFLNIFQVIIPGLLAWYLAFKETVLKIYTDQTQKHETNFQKLSS